MAQVSLAYQIDGRLGASRRCAGILKEHLRREDIQVVAGLLKEVVP
jgi:hypothetical protein